MDAPIYDTVDDDEYQALVAKRREEFSDFIVGDASNACIDDGEEEDWTKAGMPFSSDEELKGESGEKSKPRKDKSDKEKLDKEKKASATANALTATAALMGKQRLSSIFTTSVFKKRNEDKTGALMSSESVVDDVIAEFAPDDGDRERKRRRQSMNLGLGLGLGLTNRVPIKKSKLVVGDLCKKVDADDRALAPSVEKIDDKGGSKRSQGGDVKEEKVTNAIEAEAESDLSKEGGDKVFAFNAKIKEQKAITFSAADEFKAINDEGVGNGDGSRPAVSSSVLESKVNLDADGSLPFYILDAYEETDRRYSYGTVYLFGKVKAGNAYHSCCVLVKNMQRCVYAIPNGSVFDNEVILKIEKDVTDKKISASEFRTKLHEVASGLKTEIAKHLMDLNVTTFSMVPVKRSYAFDRFDIPHGENYVLKINYSFKDSPLPSDLKGDNICAVLGTHSRNAIYHPM